MPSLGGFEVLGTVANVVLRKDAVASVPFCDDEGEEARALHTSNRRTTSEHARNRKRMNGIIVEARIKRRRTRNQTEERSGSEAAVVETLKQATLPR